MLARSSVRRGRKGAALVEFAIVLPVFLLLLLGGVTLGLGLFRWQELAHLARESARWAALQDASSRTPDQIRANVVAPNAAGIDPAAVEVSTATAGSVTSVTLKYTWTPEFYFAPITFTRTARMNFPYVK